MNEKKTEIENLNEKIYALWSSRIFAEGMQVWFERHILPLFLAFKLDNKVTQIVYTGFLLHHNDTLYWTSAGHIVNQIKDILVQTQVMKKGWVDGLNTPGAEILPAALNLNDMYSIDKQKIDIGFIKLNYLEEQSLKANKRLQIMGRNAWKRENAPIPAGFFLIGYPDCLQGTEETLLSGNRTLHSVKATIISLPIEAIEDNRNVFRGRILPYLNEESSTLENISGMSGGPIFSIEAQNNEMRYRLVALQRAWVREEREIRAMSIYNVIEHLEQWTPRRRK